MNINPIAYKISKRFDESNGQTWENYKVWKSIKAERVISLDVGLCPGVIEKITTEDFKHRVYIEEFHDAFDSISWILQKVGQKKSNWQILAIQRIDSNNHKATLSGEFNFIGYDLIEIQTSISAITNCDGFDLAYSAVDLNINGLISDICNANKIASMLKEKYPNSNHADVTIWAIWEKWNE